MIDKPTNIVVHVAALMAACIAATPALADFQLQRDGAAAPVIRLLTPNVDQSAEPPRPPSRFKVAQGFGNDVPISFAARQIVPRPVSIRFGKGVDPTAMVSWRGGAPWNQVLAAAVRPLGLQIITGATTVLISR